MNTKNTIEVDDIITNKIEFTITNYIKKLEIEKLTLEKRDFLITWSDERQNCIDFNLNSKSSSLSKNVKLIKRRLKDEAKKGKKIDDETIENAIRDIEDQIIKKRDKIYSLNLTKTSENNSNDEYQSKIIEEVSKVRKEFENSSDPFKEWQQEVKKKYHKLYEIIAKHFPESWFIMEFCLAVKSIQNIHGNTLPFIGIILAKPSSLKTTVIELFRKYKGTFYSDNFTPNSMISHNSSLSEEELQKIDMLPKMNNKFVLTPELAPIFTAKDDDLQKVLGIITRIVDGKGYESDSGAQGHRKYSDIMFSWVGAAVEIPPKVWKLLSQLGFKLYFFRPNLQEKSVNDLTTIIKNNDYILKNKEIEEALLDYLRVFDAAPTTDFTSLDENNIVKVKWNFDSSRNDIIEKEQKKVLEYIAQIAKLLAPLRGTVYVSQSKTRKYQKSQNSSNNGPDEEISYQTEELDYEVDSPIIEDPSRAAVVLRNLAIANAISQGRNYFVKEDIKLIIKVALSTTRIHRSKLLELLLKNNGELTTSKIVNELAMSEPSARKAMREFEALGIVKTSRTSGSVNSELKIKLSHEFQWFLSNEFRELCKPSIIEIHSDHSRDSIYCNNNVRYQSFIIKNLCSNYYYNIKSCTDNNNNYCHTLKQNLPPEGEIKNNNDSILITNNNTISKFSNNDLKFLENKENKINFNHKTYSDSKKVENYTIQEKNDDIINNPDSSEDKGSINENSLQKNSASLGPENFQPVTLSQENCHTEKEHCANKKQIVPKNVIEDVLKVIRDENGSISLGYALQLACQKSEIVKEYLKNEKLAAKDSRKVQKLFVEINRHQNIKVEKRKPELVVKWIKDENEKEMINI